MTNKEKNGTGTEAMNADEAINKVSRAFRYALTNPTGYEYDACLLDEISNLWERVLFSHWPQGLTITPEQKRNLLMAWKYRT